MSFDIPPSVERDVEIYAERERLTPDEALLRLIQSGLREGGAKRLSPIEEGLGLLGSPEDAALLDEAVALAYEDRRRPSIRATGR